MADAFGRVVLGALKAKAVRIPPEWGVFDDDFNTVHICERRPGKGWQFELDRRTLHRCDRQSVVSRAIQRFHADKLGAVLTLQPVGDCSTSSFISSSSSFSVSSSLLVPFCFSTAFSCPSWCSSSWCFSF